MRLLSYYVVLFILLLGLCIAIHRGTPPFDKIDFNRCMKSHVFRQKYQISLQQCSEECQARPQCKSFNYIRRSLKCELEDAEGDGSNLQDCPGHVHSNIKDWTENQYPCDASNCAVGQKCQVDQVTGKADCIYEECPSPPDTKNGVKYGNNYDVGGVILYVCHEGYTCPAGSQSKCLPTGNWSSGSDVCLFDCGDPQTIGNAEISAGDTFDGSIRNAKCFDEHVFLLDRNSKGVKKGVQNFTIVCEIGGWNITKTDKCLQDCAEPKIHLEHATLEPGSTYENSVRIIKCLTGYSLYHKVNSSGGSLKTSHVDITCQPNGTWLPNENLTCLKDCENPPVTYGSYEGSAHEGDVLEIKCSNSYVFLPPLNISKVYYIECLKNGTWNRTDLSCIKDCGKPDIKNVIITPLDAGTLKSDPPRDINCTNDTVIVPKNFYYDPVLNLTCTDHGWDYNFYCKRDCGPAPNISHATLIYDPYYLGNWNWYTDFEPKFNYVQTLAGSRAFYLCDDKHGLNGTRNHLTCGEDGLWEQPSFNCKGCSRMEPLIFQHSLHSYAFGPNVTFLENVLNYTLSYLLKTETYFQKCLESFNQTCDALCVGPNTTWVRDHFEYLLVCRCSNTTITSEPNKFIVSKWLWYFQRNCANV